MKNWEALKALMEGKFIRHSSWLCKETHIGSAKGISASDLMLFKDGWELYDPGHDFAWACSELVAGRAVRRKVWNADQIIHRDGIGSSMIVWLDSGSPFHMTTTQLSATDWVSAEVANGNH